MPEEQEAMMRALNALTEELGRKFTEAMVAIAQESNRRFMQSIGELSRQGIKRTENLMAEQAQKMLAPARQQMVELGQQTVARIRRQMQSLILPVLESEREALAAMWQEYHEKMRPIFASLEIAAEAVGPVFQEAGFWISPSMPMSILREAKHLHDQGALTPSALKDAILTYYRQDDWGPLQEMVGNWQRDPLLARRMPIIRDALEAHIAGKYTLSIPALLPQVEGIAREVAGVASTRTKSVVVGVVETESSELMAAVMRDALVSFLTGMLYVGVDFRAFDEWLEEKGWQSPESLLRHAILHGVQVDYASEENSVRAFLLLDALASAFRHRQWTQGT